MNIAIDVRPLMGGKWSGVETYIHNLIKNLSELAPENTYILFANSSKDERKNIPDFGKKNIKIVQTFIPNKIFNISLLLFGYPKLDKYIEKLTGLKIDAIIFPDIRPFSCSNKSLSIQVIHDLCFKLYPQYFSMKSRVWFHLLNVRKILNKAQGIIAVSKSTKTDIENIYGISSKKIKIIYEAATDYQVQMDDKIKWEHLKKKYSIPDKYFLFLSTLEPRKNIKNLLKAFSIYKEKDKTNTKLVLVGKKYPEIFSQIKVDHSDQIIETGFIQEEEKPLFYRHAKALIYPSFYEGFGLPVLEALKCRTPVITSDISSMPEIAGKCALYINPNDHSTITSAMREIEKQETHQKLIANINKQIASFSWEKCAGEVLDYIKELSNK